MAVVLPEVAEAAAPAAEGAAGDVSTPEGMQKTFKRNPALARRNPGAVKKVDELVATGARSAPKPPKSTTASASSPSSRGSSRSSSSSGIKVPPLERVIVAAVVGVIALEFLSYLTGQYFNFSLSGIGQQLRSQPKPAYVPLYKGQQLASPPATPATGAAAGSAAAAAAAALGGAL